MWLPALSALDGRHVATTARRRNGDAQKISTEDGRGDVCDAQEDVCDA
jgi:hypothetical protein